MATSYGIGSNPAYNPATWSLGYQNRQFGVAADPVPTGSETPLEYPSVYSALANPPANMTTAIELAIPTAPVLTPDQ
jgi:hypothetical protein